jgi:hypothetical protein
VTYFGFDTVKTAGCLLLPGKSNSGEAILRVLNFAAGSLFKNLQKKLLVSTMLFGGEGRNRDFAGRI